MGKGIDAKALMIVGIIIVVIGLGMIGWGVYHGHEKDDYKSGWELFFFIGGGAILAGGAALAVFAH